MPNHPRPWHRDSLFGDGPRVPLDREQRAVWRFRLDAARRVGRITAAHVEIGRALARRLGQDGRCDPSHNTLAADAGYAPRTVRRALAALAAIGMVAWCRRLIRTGWRAEQTSNAYVLSLPDAAPVAADRMAVKPVSKISLRAVEDSKEALDAMLQAAARLPDLLARRRAMVEGKLLLSYS